MENTIKDTVKSRKIAILAAAGVDEASLNSMRSALEATGAQCKIIAPKLGSIQGSKGKAIKVDQGFLHAVSVLFDAVYIPGGAKSAAALSAEPDAIHFVNEAYKHCKAIAANGEGVKVLNRSYAGEKMAAKGKNGKDAKAGVAGGVIIDKAPAEFIRAVAQHRFWEREKPGKVPA